MKVFDTHKMKVFDTYKRKVFDTHKRKVFDTHERKVSDTHKMKVLDTHTTLSCLFCEGCSVKQLSQNTILPHNLYICCLMN